MNVRPKKLKHHRLLLRKLFIQNIYLLQNLFAGLNKKAALRKIHIHHAACGHGGERWVERAPVDGYNHETKTVFQYQGLPFRFCSNSVGTPLELAAFRSSFDTKYSRASAFWFFLFTTMVFTAFRTHFARKNTSIFMLIGSLSRRKKQVLKLTWTNIRLYTPTTRVRLSARAGNFFFCFCFFFLIYLTT